MAHSVGLVMGVLGPVVGVELLGRATARSEATRAAVWVAMKAVVEEEAVEEEAAAARIEPSTANQAGLLLDRGVVR